MNDILLLVIQIRNQLLESIDLLSLTHEWEIIVQVVQFVGVRKVNLEEVTLPSFLSQLTNAALNLIWILYPSEPAGQEVSTHDPVIQVIRIQVLKTFFPRIEPIAHVLVACLHVSMNCLSDTTLRTLLKHQQHVGVSQKLQANLGFLKAGMPSQSGRGVKVSRIEDVML